MRTIHVFQVSVQGKGPQSRDLSKGWPLWGALQASQSNHNGQVTPAGHCWEVPTQEERRCSGRSRGGRRVLWVPCQTSAKGYLWEGEGTSITVVILFSGCLVGTAWVLRTYIKCTQHCSKGNCTLSVSLETRLSVLDFVSALQKIRAETNLERKTWVCGYPQLSHHVGGQWNTTLTHNSTKEVDPGFCSGCLHRVFQRRGHDQQPVQSLQLWH